MEFLAKQSTCKREPGVGGTSALQRVTSQPRLYRTAVNTGAYNRASVMKRKCLLKAGMIIPVS